MLTYTEPGMLLVILDGWGHSPDPAVSAIDQANTPVMDRLYADFPNAELTTSGLAVGLPEGQMGNSEVGHLNIGAGRVVDQELVRVGKAIQTKSLHQNPTLLGAIKSANNRSSRIHVMGLVSDGGVHSHTNHLKALCDILDEHAHIPVYIHAFTDGRDVDPHSGLGFVREIMEYVEGSNTRIATVIGRYYAMDRDTRWERTRIAYEAIVNGVGTKAVDVISAIEKSYADHVTDEFIRPIIHTDTQDQPVGMLRSGDLVIFFNFRTDRPRQLVTALTQTDLPDHGMSVLDVDLVTMTSYDHQFRNVPVLFDKQDLSETLGQVLSEAGKTQLRIAETEKYPHVTYFFSGGREEPFPGEERVLIPSPKVATYDLQPEMSAVEVTDAAIRVIEAHHPDFICLNFANADMVGHTGIFAAAMKAVETVDTCLGRLLETARNRGYRAIIIADHGNADMMINPDGSPNTAHTTNPVPVIYVSDEKDASVSDGILADIAPTILSQMGIPVPKVMTGKVLVQVKHP